MKNTRLIFCISYLSNYELNSDVRLRTYCKVGLHAAVSKYCARKPNGELAVGYCYSSYFTICTNVVHVAQVIQFNIRYIYFEQS